MRALASSEISASSMPYSLALSAIRLAPAPLEVMTRIRPPRGTGWCAAICAAPKRFHGVRGNHAELAKRRLINFPCAGHARGVRHGGKRAALRLADFQNDDDFTDLVRAPRQIE